MPPRPLPAPSPDARGDHAAAADDRVRILVVDDRPENLLAVESVLRDPAYELVCARSGAEALRFLLHGDCALILLDVQMPEMDGFEVARLVRGNPRTRAIPIVFMTAVSRDEPFIVRGYQMGAIDYLLKPVDPHVLRCKVAAFAELHRARQEVARQAALLRDRERVERQRALEQMELKSLRRQQAASERYRRLLDGIPHAVVWSADPTSLLCTLVSRSTGALLGRTQEEWLRPSIWDELVPQEDRAALLAAVRAAAGGEPVALDHGFVRRDGTVARFRTELCPIEDGERDRPEVRGFSVDVTEARHAEEALAFLAQAGAELFSSLELGTTIRHLAALAVPALADACGVTASLPEGDVHAFAPDDGSAAAVREIALGAGGSDELRPAPLEEGGWAMTAGFEARGRVRGRIRLVRGPSRPFTDRDVRVAAALAERAGQAVENALLYQEAQEAIQLREEFISIASHELRTPLTALTLQGRLLERSVAGSGLPDLPRRVASVLRQVERMTRLVANLLDVTRLRVNRIELAPERFDLCGLVEEVSARFQEELDRAGRALRVSAAAPAVGQWDRTKLEQVLTNLVSNAIRYGGSGPIEVAVRPGAGEVRLSVKDAGRGIAPEDQARIFQRFERGQNAEGSGGLGLGLYIVRHIVQAHGGRIELESALGAGSTFTVTLPLERAVAAPEAAGVPALN